MKLDGLTQETFGLLDRRAGGDATGQVGDVGGIVRLGLFSMTIA